jgi:hypothetical protein
MVVHRDLAVEYSRHARSREAADFGSRVSSTRLVTMNPTMPFVRLLTPAYAAPNRLRRRTTVQTDGAR